MKSRIVLKATAKEMASARDYECPICMMLMIEPVMLPCKHELCYKCFLMGYTNTSDQCPFCRVRIATWARKAMRNNRVINTAKWDLIKKLFPERVKSIIEGRDIISDEEETEMQIIAEAGSLGKEYMAELEKIESERLQASQEEEAASLALIEKLCQAEGQPFIMPSVKMDSTSRSSDVAATVMPNDRTYSITDEERLKQIKEEEAASLRLIQLLQEEEEQAMRERQKREDLDRQYARMISSTLNKPLPAEPVIVDPSDCVICPSSPCASLTTSVFCVDASSPTSSAIASSAGSSASAGILPTTPSTSSVECPGSVTHVSTEATDKVTTPNSIYRKCETNVKGKKPATTSLTKWLKMSQSQIPEAALGSNSESGMTVSDSQPATVTLNDPIETNPPTPMNTSSTGELATELLCTVSGPNVAGDTSQQDNFSEVRAAVIPPDLTSCEPMQTSVHSEFASTISEDFLPDICTSEFDQVFGFGVLDVLCKLNDPHREATRESNSIGFHNDGALSYSGQPNKIPATDNAMQCSFSQNSDLFPMASGSRIKEPKQRGVKHGVTGNATGMLANTSTSDTASHISGVFTRGSKGYRSRSSAVATPAKKALKRSSVCLNDDPQPCCSTSSMSQTTNHSVLPNNSSCCSAENKMCLNWSEVNMSSPGISKDTFADAPSLTRSDFNSDESYRLYLEEQDHQVALRLQRMFDLESKPRKIPRSAEPGGYNLRCRGKLSTNNPEEIN